MSLRLEMTICLIGYPVSIQQTPSKPSIPRQSFMPIRDSSTRNPRPPTRMYSSLINSGRIIAFLQLSLFFLLHPPPTLLIQLLVLLFDLGSSLLGIASASGTVTPLKSANRTHITTVQEMLYVRKLHIDLPRRTHPIIKG